MRNFFKKRKCNSGMTYVELIVVLSIFGIMSSVVLVNYQDFQAKIEIKSLANDIVLKINEAQRFASSGRLDYKRQVEFENETGISASAWKPSYGVNFDIRNPVGFISFEDLDDSVLNNAPAYNSHSGKCDNLECVEQININKNIFIKDIISYCSANEGRSVNDLSVSFMRSNPNVFLQSSSADCPLSEAVIRLVSNSGGASSSILIYPSGIIKIQ